MTDYIWPSNIVPSATSWRLLANTAAFSSPLSGITRTLGRGGDRWVCSVQVNNLTDDKRAILQSFLARLRGQANRVWMPDHSLSRRGSFSTGELLTNNTFENSTTGWATNYCTVSSTDNVLRQVVTAHSAGQFPGTYQYPTVVSGGRYIGRALFLNASSSGQFGVQVDLKAGTTASTTGSTSGFLTVAQYASTTSGVFTVYRLDSASTGDKVYVAYTSLSRCFLIYGNSQTGSAVNCLNGLPASTVCILRAGDYVQIGNYFHMLTASMDSNSSSVGVMHITTPLRTSPADHDPVIVHQPRCRMMIADQTVGWSNEPKGQGRALSSFSLEFVEDLA